MRRAIGILFFLLLTIPLSCRAQDPYCRVELVSGAPVWFYFNQASHYASGKQAPYLTVLRITYTKRPSRLCIYHNVQQELFDGPSPSSRMRVENIRLSFVEARYMGSGAGAWTFFPVIADNALVQASEMELAYADVSGIDLEGGQAVFYIYLKYSCIPRDDSPFSELEGGGYVNTFNVRVRTWYYGGGDSMWPH